MSDDLWEAIAPLLPPEPRVRRGGHPRVGHRAALGGILYVLRHGLRWRDLPQELGYGSGVTAGGAWNGGGLALVCTIRSIRV